MSLMAGTTSAGKSFQRSVCGEEFDEYVFRAVDGPFPFSPVGASSRELPGLWKGRYFQIYYHNKWRGGKVHSWKQYNANPHTMLTKWSVLVDLDTLEPGDPVEVNVSGMICKDLKEEGNSTIQIRCNNGVDITVKAADGNIVPRMKLYVNRLNVQGGGTLKLHDSDEEEPLISLEWLTPASPSINLNEHILSFDCPCCRAAEPVMAAFEAPTQTKMADCPVCMETTDCRVLGCGHAVCHGCWNSCRQAATRVSEDLGDLNKAELKKERAKRNRLLNKKRRRDESPSRDFELAFLLTAEATRSVEGLKRLRWLLMVEPPALWAVDDVFSLFGDLSIPVLQVILQVIEERKDEMPYSQDGTMVDKAGDASHFCCYFIAKQLEEAHDYLAAVPWNELSMFQATHSEGGQEVENLAPSYLFSSQIYFKADLLSKSLNDFDACGALLGESAREQGEETRSMIVDAMKEWTGSSSKLTMGV